MFEVIKKWYFYKDFISDKRSKVSIKEINTGQSIGILFNGSSEDDRKKVLKIKKQLNPSGSKIIKSLAFLNNNLPLDNVDYAAYNNKDLKWYGLPFGEKVDEFIQESFDILIVLCEYMLPHYEFIIAHSNAKFIIGPDIAKSDKYFSFIVEAVKDWEIESVMNKIIKNIDNVSIK
jgi:hypothetical protein